MNNEIHPKKDLPHCFYVTVPPTDTSRVIGELKELQLNIESDLENKWKKENYFQKENTGFFCYNGVVWEDIPNHRELFGGISFVDEQIIQAFSLPELIRQIESGSELLGEPLDLPAKKDFLKNISPDKLMEDVYLEAVRENPDNFYNIPKDFRSDRIIMEVLRQDGVFIHEVGAEKAKPQYLLKALETYGEALGFFPKELLTEENCLKAVKQTGHALEFVPEELRTKEMCRLALTPPEYFPNQHHLIFKDVPFSDVVMDSFKEYVEKGASAKDVFSFIRPDIIDQPLVDEGLKRDGMIFKMLPNQFQTEENARKAVETSGVLAVPYKFWNSETVNIHAKNNHNLLDLVYCNLNPEDFLNIERARPGSVVMPDKKFSADGNHIPIPEEMLDSPNVFTLADKVEEKLGIKLSIEDAGKLLKDGELSYKKMERNNHVYIDGKLSYNSKEGTINNSYKSKGVKIPSDKEKKRVMKV